MNYSLPASSQQLIAEWQSDKLSQCKQVSLRFDEVLLPSAKAGRSAWLQCWEAAQARKTSRFKGRPSPTAELHLSSPLFLPILPTPRRLSQITKLPLCLVFNSQTSSYHRESGSLIGVSLPALLLDRLRDLIIPTHRLRIPDTARW